MLWETTCKKCSNLTCHRKLDLSLKNTENSWIGTCKWGSRCGSCTLGRSAPAPRFHPRLRSLLRPTASVPLFFIEAWLYVEKHTAECPASHWQTTGDSCCHEIGTSLIDECTAVDKPLHEWIESDIFAFGSRHTRPSIDDRGENCAFACDKVRPSHAFFARLLRPHVMILVVKTDNLVDGQRQRPKSLQKEASDSFDNMLLPTSRIMRAAREKNTQTSQRPRVLHHSQLCRCLPWRQKHGGLLCHRNCLMRA